MLFTLSVLRRACLSAGALIDRLGGSGSAPELIRCKMVETLLDCWKPAAAAAAAAERCCKTGDDCSALPGTQNCWRTGAVPPLLFPAAAGYAACSLAGPSAVRLGHAPDAGRWAVHADVSSLRTKGRKAHMPHILTEFFRTYVNKISK